MVIGSLLSWFEYQEIVLIQKVDIQVDCVVGLFGMVNLLQLIVVVMGLIQVNNQFSGFVVGGGIGIQMIDLCGLGVNCMLVLFDGQCLGLVGIQG